MFNGKKVSLVLPAYNEEEGVLDAINDFQRVSLVDEIIVIDNNSTDNTPELIKQTNAKYILEQVQGYGSAIKRGLRESSGDIIVVTEPDGSFSANDLERLLDYTKNYDCVFGSRTFKNYIEKGAKMNFLLRLGNIIVAKFLSILFLKNNFTDVGCTYKVFSRDSYNLIKDELQVIGSELQPEIMIRILLKKQKIIEVPVIYRERSGQSKITKNFIATAVLALKMIKLIILLRVKSFYEK